jgi:hypothetical protein
MANTVQTTQIDQRVDQGVAVRDGLTVAEVRTLDPERRRLAWAVR